MLVQIKQICFLWFLNLSRDGNWDFDDDIDHRLLTWTGCIWALVRASGVDLFVCGNGNFFKFGLGFLV